MVLFMNPSPDSNRRLCLSLKGTLFLSWKSSKTDLGQETRDDLLTGCRRIEELSPQRRVHFSREQLVMEIPEEDHPITEQELRISWYKNDDYSRFEKDRVLTSFGYISSRRWGGSLFDDTEYTTRGLENLCDSRLGRRQIGEKKDLTKAIRTEEERQKEEGGFPDLDKFRSISLKHTKSGRERAFSLGQDDAKSCRPRQKNQMVEAFSRASRSMSIHHFRRKNSAFGGMQRGVGGMQRRRSIG